MVNYVIQSINYKKLTIKPAKFKEEIQCADFRSTEKKYNYISLNLTIEIYTTLNIKRIIYIN